MECEMTFNQTSYVCAALMSKTDANLALQCAELCEYAPTANLIVLLLSRVVLFF